MTQGLSHAGLCQRAGVRAGKVRPGGVGLETRTPSGPWQSFSLGGVWFSGCWVRPGVCPRSSHVEGQARSHGSVRAGRWELWGLQAPAGPQSPALSAGVIITQPHTPQGPRITPAATAPGPRLREKNSLRAAQRNTRTKREL